MRLTLAPLFTLLALLGGLPALAAGSPSSADLKKVARPPAPLIEVAFVLDTTGSMSGLIEGAKEKIWSIASNIAQGQPAPRLRVALVGYRDRGDAYITRRFDLSDDLDAVFQNLRSFHAEGGGDTPEHVGQGLGEAVSLLSWSGAQAPSLKMIFLVGDAPPHLYNDGWDYRVWARRALEKGITVHTVRCGNDPQTEVAWREMARLADGSFSSIGQTGSMVAVVTPYDQDIAQTNRALAAKTLYAGSAQAREQSAKRVMEVGAMSPSAQGDRAAYMSQKTRGGGASTSAPVAVAGSVDLTAAPAQLEGLADNQLPDTLRGLSPSARKARVEVLAGERRALEQQVSQLAAKREGWMSTHAAKPADSFDAKVMGEVKARAAKVGVRY